MREYRARSSPVETSVLALPKTEKWQTLDEQYGLTDMFDEPSDITASMSLDEEFAAFVNAPLSPKGTSILAFWQVCGDIVLSQSLLIAYRCAS
jgi:hypothetical protein